MIALIDDTSIAYDDVGSGLPVVFLHAFPLNRTMWDPQVTALVAEARCIPIDLRALGESKGGGHGPFSMDRYADDVAGVLDALQVQRAVVVGISMGGYVAFALWRRHKGRVRGLVLSNTRATADSPDALARRQQLLEIARTQGTTGVANAQIAGLMGKTTREKRPDIYDAMHRMMAQAPLEGVTGAIEALMSRPDSTDTCATIDVPTLVIAGDEDVLTPPKEAAKLAAAIPGARVEILQGAGHLANVERPAAFNTVLSEFLATLLYN